MMMMRVKGRGIEEEGALHDFLSCMWSTSTYMRAPGLRFECEKERHGISVRV